MVTADGLLRPEEEEEFWRHVNQRSEDDCWRWTYTRFASGYGCFSVDKRARKAHRVSLSLATGIPLSTRMWALHSCDNRACVNPWHLRWGTPKDNSGDMVERGRHRSQNAPRKVVCKRGHELLGGNLIERKDGTRVCRTCQREATKTWQAKNRSVPQNRENENARQRERRARAKNADEGRE